jgi:phosphoribosylanthranilate isomerase
MSPPKVKICGLTRRGDAEHAAERGADYLGAVLVPGTPRALRVSQARDLFRGISTPTVVVVADMELQEAAEAADAVTASVVQLHGDEPPELVALLREAGPWQVWKAVRMRNREDLSEGLRRFGEVADGLLVDGWHPEKRGGTGSPFSWDEVEGLRGRIPPGLHFIAAGGLTPENVEDAIRRLRPQVVDVSSGVEGSPGRKDPRKVEAFLTRVREGR